MTKKKLSAFEQAFKKNKDAGKKEFTYNGKKYTTKTKDDVKKSTKSPKYAETPKKGPIPSSRSDAVKSMSKEPSTGLSNVAFSKSSKTSAAKKTNTDAKSAIANMKAGMNKMANKPQSTSSKKGSFRDAIKTEAQRNNTAPLKKK